MVNLRKIAILSLVCLVLNGLAYAAPNSGECVRHLVKPSVTRKSQYQFVVSGGGPAGLTEALQLVKAGIPAGEILVLEKRGPGEAHGHGTRNRIVTLDSYSEDVLKSLGVVLEGNELDAIHFVHGRERHLLRLNGAQSTVIENLMGRRVSRTLTLGYLEQALLKTVEEKGIEVVFSNQAQAWKQIEGKVYFQVGERSDENEISETPVIAADFALIAEGKKSVTRDELQLAYQPHSKGENPRYLGYDFKIPAYLQRKTGSFYNFFDEQGAIIGYLFGAGDRGSLTIYTSKDFDIHDLRQWVPYQTFIRKMISAADFGFQTISAENIFQFDGALAQSEQIRVQQILLTGDAARSTDPASGNGVNTAIAFDSVAVRDFALALTNAGQSQNSGVKVDAALNQLSKALLANTQYTFEMSVWIQNVMKWIFKNWSFSETMMGMIEAAPLLPEPIVSPFHPGTDSKPKNLKETLAKKLRALRTLTMEFTPFNSIGKNILSRTNRLSEPLTQTVYFEEALDYGKSALSVPIPPKNPRGLVP